MKLAYRIAAFAVLLALPTLVFAQESADVEKAIIDAAAKVESCKADITMKTEMETPQMSMKSEGTGYFEFQNKDGKQLSRMELKMVSSTKVGGEETRMESTTLSITDGEYSYVIADQMGQKMVTKSKFQDTGSNMASKVFFDNLRQNYTLKRLDDAKFDGRDCYVIEAAPKEGGYTGKQIYYFAKDHGLLLKTEIFTADGKPMGSTTMTNYKINPSLDPKRFVFEAPEGVPVQDLTASQ